MKGLRRILDPEGTFLHKWNTILALSCVAAVCLDPLLFYTPLVDAHNLCFSIDTKLAITFCVVRSFIDAFYVFHIFIRFRTGSKAIIKRYLMSHFIADILSILPLPQLATARMIPAMMTPVQNRALTIVIMGQNLVRLLRLFPLYNVMTRTSGLISATAWDGAAMNFCLYMLAGHVSGAFWYLASVERTERCWRQACHRSSSCNPGHLYCGGNNHGSNSFLHSFCSPLDPSESVFDYGIYLNAIKFQIRRDFVRRFFYCFVWGLRNLSSLGQNLETSDDNIGESSFVVVISFMGLILFSFLAGNIQRYLQCLTVKRDELRVKLIDQEEWMARTMLPESLRSRVRQHEQYMWVKNRGVDEESLICNLPMDLRRDIKRHQCCRLLRTVPMFEKMDEQLMDSLCCCLKHVSYTAHTILERQGFPIYQMLFIMRGKILTTTTNGGRTGFFNAVDLKPGDFCGEELLTWALDPSSPSTLPISTRTLRAVEDVEAFCLMPEDLKAVASQFRRLHSKQFQQTFRFYSQQWKSWGASFIQAAWRRYRKRKIERELREAEEGNAPPNIAAAVYASRNMLGNLRRGHQLINNNMASPKLPTLNLLPQKLPEPDFGAGDPS